MAAVVRSAWRRQLRQPACRRRVAVAQQIKHAAQPGHPGQHAHRHAGLIHRRLNRDALADNPADGHHARPRKLATVDPLDHVLGDGDVLGREPPHQASVRPLVAAVQTAVRQTAGARLADILTLVRLPPPLPLPPVRIGEPLHDLPRVSGHPQLPHGPASPPSGKPGHTGKYPKTTRHRRGFVATALSVICSRLAGYTRRPPGARGLMDLGWIWTDHLRPGASWTRPAGRLPFRRQQPDRRPGQHSPNRQPSQPVVSTPVPTGYPAARIRRYVIPIIGGASWDNGRGQHGRPTAGQCGRFAAVATAGPSGAAQAGKRPAQDAHE
jgi:hypothetical protein